MFVSLQVSQVLSTSPFPAPAAIETQAWSRSTSSPTLTPARSTLGSSTAAPWPTAQSLRRTSSARFEMWHLRRSVGAFASETLSFAKWLYSVQRHFWVRVLHLVQRRPRPARAAHPRPLLLPLLLLRKTPSLQRLCFRASSLQLSWVFFQREMNSCSLLIG